MVERRSSDVGTRTRELRLIAMLVFISGVLLAAGLVVPMLSGTNATAAPLVLGDVSEAHIVEIRNQRGEVILYGEFRSRVDPLGNTEKDAALIDQRGRMVIGEVEVEIPAPGRLDRRTELEVDIIGLPAHEIFAVVIDDRIVGRFTTDDRGSVDMELQEGEIPPPVVSD